VDAAADQQAAEDAVLRASDLPGGFVASEDDGSDGDGDALDEESEALLADCLGADESALDEDGDPKVESKFASAPSGRSATSQLPFE
jgi:hypothetical protein